MASLPPDLDRLGEQLARAAGHAQAARRARREQRLRVAFVAVIGALAFAALTPGDLGHATHELRGADLVSATIPTGCEHARGGGYMMPRCAAADAAVPHRPYAWR